MPAHRSTPRGRLTPARTLLSTVRGHAGAFGGRWGFVPQPPQWNTTTVQVCGAYPFSAGSYRPTTGAPLGHDLNTYTAVATDHEQLYREGHITSPTLFLFGINGVGKSSTAQGILLRQVGRGMAAAIFDPIKGEHVPLARALGADVFQPGPGAGKDKINPLSKGPLGSAARRIGGTVGAELELLARDKAKTLMRLIARVGRGRPLEAMEDVVLDAIVDTITDREPVPVTRHLITAFESPSERMLSVSGQRTAESFWLRFGGQDGLGETLRTLVTGEMGMLLGGEESVEFNPGNPGGFCFDTSSIGKSNTKLLSAAMLSTWSLGMDAIDAHWELAQHEQRRVHDAAAAGQVHVPEVRWGGYSTLMDEFWYPMRACDGMVDLVDELTRTNRSKGTAEMKITHSPKDARSLPNPEDREKARGFAERSGVIGLMSLTREDLHDISSVRHLNAKEIDTVAGFSADPSWAPPRTGAKAGPPPGAGKILLKLPERIGIPVQMTRTAVQERLHITNERYRAQDGPTDD